VKTASGARSTSPSLFLLVVIAFACDVELGEEEDAEVTLELLAEEESEVIALALAGIVEVPETGSVMLPPTTRPAVPSERTVPLIVTGGPPMDRVFPSITIVGEPLEAESAYPVTGCPASVATMGETPATVSTEGEKG